MTDKGHCFVVVGPSGVGKDTVMEAVADRLSGFSQVQFARRVITRSTSAGGENHKGVEPEAFEQMVHENRFAVHWQAHGLSYGIPVETLAHVAHGGIVICNGSRAVLHAFRASYPALTVVSLVADKEVLEARLAARGRESASEIKNRLARAKDHEASGPDVVTIDNSGDLQDAVEAFTAVVLAHLDNSESCLAP